MRAWIMLMAAAGIAGPVLAQATPLDRAEPYFMTAQYPQAFAEVRNYTPDPRTLRLDFVFGVSACLSGDDNNRALGLMMLHAIATTYPLTTAQAVKLSGYIGRCQPPEGVVNPIIPVNTTADADGSGSTYKTLYRLNTNKIAGLDPFAARAAERGVIALHLPAAAPPTAAQLVAVSRAAMLHKLIVVNPAVKP